MDLTLGSFEFEDPELGVIRLTSDGYSGPGDLVTLLVHPEVQQHLQMSEAQRAQARQISEEYRTALRRHYEDFEEREPVERTRRRTEQVEATKSEVGRGIRQLLDTEQLNRLQRLSWRIRDGEALFDDEVADALRITAEQWLRLLAARDDNQAKWREALEKMKHVRFKSQEDQRAFEAKYEREANDRLLAVLTAAQRDKFEQLKKGTVPSPEQRP